MFNWQQFAKQGFEKWQNRTGRMREQPGDKFVQPYVIHKDVLSKIEAGAKRPFNYKGRGR